MGCAQARQLYIGTFTADTTFQVQWCAIVCHRSISADSTKEIQVTQSASYLVMVQYVLN